MRTQFGVLAAVLLSAMVAEVSGCGDRARPSGDTVVPARQVAAAGGTVAAAPMRLPRNRTAAAPGAASARPTPGSIGTGGAPAASVRDTGGGSAPDSAKRTPAASQPSLAAPLTAPKPPAPSKLAVALAHLPFENQERLEYQVKYGFLGVGSAVLEVQGLDTVRGTPAIHATFSVNGGVRVYRVNDHYESWFDPISFSTLRATQKIDEGSYDRQRNFEFFPERRTFTENTNPEVPTVPDPLDEASFIFFLRTIPLDVGQTYEFTRYFRLDKNPVRVIVERKEHIKVPAGEFNTIVVRPVIKTTGIFGEGGKAEVWFTDDSTRTLVQLKSSLKFGSLNLYLRNRRPGTPWEDAGTIASPTP